MRDIEFFTVGHSNRSLDQFLDLLRQHEIAVLVDIRRFPSSRTFSHFNRDNRLTELEAHGIDYIWTGSLGGRRPKAKDFVSPNTGLRNDSFRNYADYMLTDEFRKGMNKLGEIAGAKRTAIMCAESVFWRCHRNGGTVQHIFPDGEAKPHSLTTRQRWRMES